MKRIMLIVGAGLLVLAAAVAKPEPAAAEVVLRWASATQALTFDPHGANNHPTIVGTSQVYEPLVDFDSSWRIEPALRGATSAVRRGWTTPSSAPG